MKTRRTSFLSVLALLTLLLSTSTFAVDPIWNMRYTYGPDAAPAPKIGGGIGLRNNFGDQVLIPINIMGQIAKGWDIGAKLDLYTYNRLKNMTSSIDIGSRVQLGNAGFVELDGYIGLNRSNSSAVVITYSKEHFVAKNFSNYYEGRVGFLDGATGDGGWAKIAIGTTPTLRFGSSFKFMMEINASASLGHFTKDFMADIIPKAEISLGGTRLRLDFDIGVLQEGNNDQQTIALYVLQAF